MARGHQLPGTSVSVPVRQVANCFVIEVERRTPSRSLADRNLAEQPQSENPNITSANLQQGPSSRESVTKAEKEEPDGNL